MSPLVTHWIVGAATAYAAAGAAFAVPFALHGAGTLEPVARQGTSGFRLFLLPGAATLWPWLAFRWWKATR
jgi:hypothetical protein